MRFGGARRLCVTLVACWLLGTACTPDTAVEGDTPATAEPSEAAGAADLRLSLEQAFAFHAHVVTEAARGGDEAASTTAQRSARALADIVAEAYDEDAAEDALATLKPVREALATHHAQVKEDGDAQPPAPLRNAPARLASFMADVTEQEMEREATEELATPAVDSLIATVEHHAGKDFERAYAAHRDAFAEMLDLGRALAAGISEHQPEQYGGARSTALLELRSALRQFLGEHAGLAVSVTRAGAVGAPDFKAAAAALNGNTDDLVAALQSSYGTAVEPFARAWRHRISSLADYTVATARERSGKRDDARRALKRSDDAVAAALDQLTDGDVGRRPTRGALTRLTAALVRQVDAATEERLDEAEAARAQAFERSLGVADVLAAGIAANRPEEYADR